MTLSLFADVWQDTEHDAVLDRIIPPPFGLTDPFIHDLEGLCVCSETTGIYIVSFTLDMWLHVLIRTEAGLARILARDQRNHQNLPDIFPLEPDPANYQTSSVLTHEIKHVKADFATAESFAAGLGRYEAMRYTRSECEARVVEQQNAWNTRYQALLTEQSSHSTGWDWYNPTSAQATRIIRTLQNWFTP